jgi:hypothetical protein
MADNEKPEKYYAVNFNQQKAPDCRGCIYYWNNRKDREYRDAFFDGHWLEITEYDEDGSEKHFERISTFKHGCKLFKTKVPQDQIPSLFIYNTIGKHCPITLKSSINSHNERDYETEYIREEHNIDIIV